MKIGPDESESGRLEFSVGRKGEEGEGRRDEEGMEDGFEDVLVQIAFPKDELAETPFDGEDVREDEGRGAGEGDAREVEGSWEGGRGELEGSRDGRVGWFFAASATFTVEGIDLVHGPPVWREDSPPFGLLELYRSLLVLAGGGGGRTEGGDGVDDGYLRQDEMGSLEGTGMLGRGLGGRKEAGDAREERLLLGRSLLQDGLARDRDRHCGRRRSHAVTRQRSRMFTSSSALYHVLLSRLAQAVWHRRRLRLGRL